MERFHGDQGSTVGMRRLVRLQRSYRCASCDAETLGTTQLLSRLRPLPLGGRDQTGGAHGAGLKEAQAGATAGASSGMTPMKVSVAASLR